MQNITLSKKAEKGIAINTRTFLRAFFILFLLDGVLGRFFNIDAITIALWFIFCFLLFVFNLKFCLKYILIMFYFVTNVIGVFVIENNSIFLFELWKSSERYNSLWLITFVHFAFFAVLLLLDSRLEKKIDRKKIRANFRFGRKKLTNEILYFFAILFAILLAYLVLRAKGNSAANLQVDRFIYQHEYISGMWGVLNRYITYFVPIVVLLLERNKKIFAISLLALYFLYMILVGHKFGTFIMAFSMLIPFFVRKYHIERFNIQNMKRILTIGILVIVFLSLTVFTYMNNTYGTSSDSLKNYLMNRLAQQGQMWWSIYGLEAGKGMHISELFTSLGSFFQLDKQVIETNDYGIYKLMKMVTPSNIYQSRLERYSRYAFSTEASLYYYLKAIGLVLIIILLAVITCYIYNYFWKCTKGNSVILAIISGRFCTIILSVLLQSDFNVLFSRNAVALAFVFFALVHYYTQRSQQKTPNRLLQDAQRRA